MYILIKNFPMGIACIHPILVETFLLVVRLHANNNANLFLQHTGEQTVYVLEDTGNLVMGILPDKDIQCEILINDKNLGLEPSKLLGKFEAMKLYEGMDIFLKGLGVKSFSMKFKKLK